jgi:hypothetical protein
MRKIVTIALGLLLLPSCQQKSAPEFYMLESKFQTLVARESDDAFDTDEMSEIANGLKAIAPGTLESPKAAALLAKIAEETKRVANDRAEEEKEKKAQAAAEARNFPSGGSSGSTREATPEVEPVDAGLPDKPVMGMSETDFRQAFGKCFIEGPTRKIPGVGEGKGLEVRADPACQSKFGSAAGKTVYHFVGGKLATTSLETPPPPATEPPSIPPKPAAAGAPAAPGTAPAGYPSATPVGTPGTMPAPEPGTMPTGEESGPTGPAR